MAYRNALLEWILAAVWANYTPSAFFELDEQWQSTVVAAYRVSQQIESVIALQQSNDAKANAKKPARKPHK